MSFNVDLWNGFDIIKNEFSVNKKRVKLILDILTSYSNIQKEYCKGLDNLYKEIKESKDFFKSNFLLDESINLLIKSFKIECEKNKSIYNNTMKNILDLKEKLERIKMQISPYFTENIQNKEAFTKILNILILKQEAFNKSFKELFYKLAEKEAQTIIEQKSNNTEKKNNDKFNNSEIITTKNEKRKSKDIFAEITKKNVTNYINNALSIEDSNKITNLMKKLSSNQKEYIKYILESDKHREKYNKITEELLVHLEKQFKLLIFLFQTAIQNFIKDKINEYNDILELNKSNNINYYSKINYKTETVDFITRNATKEFPMNKLEFIPYKITKIEINQKIAKYGKFSKDDIDQIFNQINNFVNNNKLNIYENEYLRQSFINRSFTDLLKKVEKVNRMRRSGSSDMFNLKNIGNCNILTNFKNIENEKNMNFERKYNSNLNNIKLIENKDDLALNIDPKKESNYNFIKDFVVKLIMTRGDDKKDILFDIYSDNSSEEDNNENTKEKNKITKQSYIYNELLFGFMDLIAINNKDSIENIEYFISVLGFHRSKGYFVLNDNAYKIFINIFNYILFNYKTVNNIIKNIILFAQTFYKTDEENPDNKIYILNGLKNHIAFNNVETWHRAINYNLSLSIKNNNNYSLNILNKEEYCNNLKKLMLNTFISYLYDVRLGTTNKNVYEQVKNFYISIYGLDKKMIEEQIDKLMGETKNEINDDKNSQKNEEKK